MKVRHSRQGVTSRLRLRRFDYTEPGSYVVTVCIKNHRRLLGDVVDGRVLLSPAGVVDSWWFSIPRQFPDETLDAMVVMPKHVHGVLMTGSRTGAVSLLSEIVGRFKSWTTRDYGVGVDLENWPRFEGRLWQEGYYDHIVRNDADLDRIRVYIEWNPSRWKEDEYHVDSFDEL